LEALATAEVGTPPTLVARAAAEVFSAPSAAQAGPAARTAVATCNTNSEPIVWDWYLFLQMVERVLCENDFFEGGAFENKPRDGEVLQTMFLKVSFSENEVFEDEVFETELFECVWQRSMFQLGV